MSKESTEDKNDRTNHEVIAVASATVAESDTQQLGWGKQKTDIKRGGGKEKWVENRKSTLLYIGVHQKMDWQQTVQGRAEPQENGQRCGLAIEETGRRKSETAPEKKKMQEMVPEKIAGC